MGSSFTGASLQQPEMTHENILSQSSEGKNLLGSEPSKLDHYVDDLHKYAERSIFLLPDSTTPSQVGNSTKRAMIDLTVWWYFLQYSADTCLKLQNLIPEFLKLIKA